MSDKASKIENAKSNLPMPEKPETSSKKTDWEAAEARTTGMSSGGVSTGDVSTGPGVTSGLREPATRDTNDVDMSRIGRQGKEGLEETPKDARNW
ncbi:hypothetical protein N0V88_002479 [Collariella sp. IMI 366227]|nr:hypothetical protein N0V88_002479 [Collariella sp. IMI 366227]